MLLINYKLCRRGWHNIVFKTDSVLHVVVEVADDVVEVLEHDVGVVGSEGERGSDPDAGLSTPTQVDPLLPEVVDDLVPQRQALHINGTECSQTASSRQKLREPLLEIIQAPHDGISSLLHKIKQRVFFYNFDNLGVKVKKSLLLTRWYLLQHDDLVRISNPGAE